MTSIVERPASIRTIGVRPHIATGATPVAEGGRRAAGRLASRLSPLRPPEDRLILFSALALAVVLSLFASYVVALTVVPLFCAKFIKGHKHDHSPNEGGGFNHWFNVKFHRFLDGHVQHVRDGLAFVVHFKSFTVVARSVTYLAGHIHIRQEVHFNLECAIATARLASTTFDVK